MVTLMDNSLGTGLFTLEWRKMGQVDLPSKGEPKVRLNAGGDPQNAERWAHFSHFRILEPTD